MNANAPQVQQPPEDPWIPRRVHDSFRRVRRVGRGRNRRYIFRGQQPDETVKMVIRAHKFFLILPALPLVGAIIGLFVVIGLSGRFPGAGSFWTLLEYISVIAIIIASVYFLYNDLALWWLNTTIITDKRILSWEGFLSPSREEVPLQNVVQVAVDQRDPLSLLLSYGDLYLYLVGGRLVLKRIPNPKKVRDSLSNITTQAKQGAQKPPPQPVVFSDPDLTEVLAKLAKNEDVPRLPNADEKYAHRQRPDRIRGPMRTFGGPLRLPCDVTYTTDEYTVKYIQRSLYVLYGKLILPILLLVAAIISTFYVSFVLPLASVAILVILLSIGYLIINYIDDVYILTNKRIIDIERRFLFFDEQHVITEYAQVREIKVQMRNPLEIALDIGHVIIETPGTNPNIEMSLVDHPFSIQDMVIAIKGFQGKVDKIKAKNDLKNDLNTWFGDVLTVLEKKMVNRGVPNLQKLDLWTAAELARELGMKVVPVGEDPSYPNIAPGLIVAQNPLPGTLMRPDSQDPEDRPQIHVVLSRRP
jgi:Bacterial PH domain